MRPFFLDTEIIPQGAPEHRAALAKTGGDWRTEAPAIALESAKLPDVPTLKPVSSRLTTPKTIAEHEARHFAEYQAEMAGYSDAVYAAAMAWWREGSLIPERAIIHSYVCAGLVESGGYMGDEKALLMDLEHELTCANPTHIVGANVTFDAGMVFARAMHHGLHKLAGMVASLPYAVAASLGMRDRQPQLLDLTDLWQPAKRGRHYMRLQAICDALGIDHSEANPIDGSMVLDTYMDGGDATIYDHCTADVRDLRDAFVILAGVHGIPLTGDY